MLDVKQTHQKTFRGSPPFRYAELQNTGNKDRDHSSWYSFDDEQALRDRWWHPKAGETVLDIGAAYGSYALPALALGARVVCFSPADFDTQVLELNLSLNPDLARRCLVVRDGLYSGEGWFDPDRCKFSENAPVVMKFDVYMPPDQRAQDEQWLKVRALDDFLDDRPGIEMIDWIKMDVEGAELEVLKGAERTLHLSRPNILVENHSFHDAAMRTKDPAWPGLEIAVRDHVLDLDLGYVCDGPHQHCAVSHSFFYAKR